MAGLIRKKNWACCPTIISAAAILQTAHPSEGKLPHAPSPILVCARNSMTTHFDDFESGMTKKLQNFFPFFALPEALSTRFLERKQQLVGRKR